MGEEHNPELKDHDIVPCYDEGMKRMWLEGIQSNDPFHGAEFARIIKELHKNECSIINEMHIVLEI